MRGIKPNDIVTSSFEVIGGFDIAPDYFDAPHIGIAASLTEEGFGGNAEVMDYFRALGMSDQEIWIPDTNSVTGGEVIKDVVSRMSEAILKLDKVTEKTVLFFGEVVILDKVQKYSGGLYDDSLPHVDFVPPETPCSGLILSNTGGTIGLSGEYIYLGNTIASYAEATIGMDAIESGPGEALYTDDARTFLHNRNPDMAVKDRVLLRLFAEISGR